MAIHSLRQPFYTTEWVFRLTLTNAHKRSVLFIFPPKRYPILSAETFKFTRTRIIKRFSLSSASDPNEKHARARQKVSEPGRSIVHILKQSNTILPQVVLSSTLLALIFPPTFSWFTSRYYAPALGFLMFAVGINSRDTDFLEAFNKLTVLLIGFIGQYAVKPILGYLFGIVAVSIFNLPTSIGAGIMLVSCVSGAQLSNYATFLTDPPMAPLSIVMTSLSTATAVFITPLLSHLLVGRKLPVDIRGMISSIMQIVVTPISAGLLLNRFLPIISNFIKPFLPSLSVLVTACCVGAPLAINVDSVLSRFGATVSLLVFAFHLSSFVIGYFLPSCFFHGALQLKPLQRTISFETGMQSSLLALALANKFFPDPLVAVPAAISTVMMSMMGFSLVMIWKRESKPEI